MFEIFVYGNQALLKYFVAATLVKGEEEVMKNLTTVTWAHAVNNKTYLEAALASEQNRMSEVIMMDFK